jgi:large subunit ribosomal protein L30
MAKTENAKMLRVRQVRSVIGYNKKQAEVVRGLGLRRIGHTVEVIDHPATRGMVHKVRHLVAIVD